MMQKFERKLDEIEKMKTDIARITVNVEEDMKKMSGESEVHKSNIVRL